MAKVISKGRIWSLAQGAASSLKPETSDSCRAVWSMVALTGAPESRVRAASKMAVWPMYSWSETRN